MEKFAECFTSQNEGVFQSADTAFILAFSVIMLQTDLHNPNIKPEKKMTVEMFIRNNKGISVDGGDLPDDLLEGIYKRILAQPFTLKEDDEAREALAKTSKVESGLGIDVSIVFGSNAEDKKRERFARERETMLLKSEQLFRKRQTSKATTNNNKTSNPPPDYISPSDAAKLMFNVTWSPLLGALSQIFEMSQDETSIKLCLSAISYSVRISAYCDISVARETFVNSLSKFTTLGSIKLMHKKHVECIQTLLDIAADDGEYLGESWTPVLQCISQLGRLRLSASGLLSDHSFLGDHDASKDPLNKRQATKIEVCTVFVISQLFRRDATTTCFTVPLCVISRIAKLKRLMAVSFLLLYRKWLLIECSPQRFIYLRKESYSSLIASLQFQMLKYAVIIERPLVVWVERRTHRQRRDHLLERMVHEFFRYKSLLRLLITT